MAEKGGGGGKRAGGGGGKPDRKTVTSEPATEILPLDAGKPPSRPPPSHLKKQLREAEFQLDRLTTAIAKIDQKLSDPGLYADQIKARDLTTERQKLTAQLATTETAWHKITEQME